MNTKYLSICVSIVMLCSCEGGERLKNNSFNYPNKVQVLNKQKQYDIAKWHAYTYLLGCNTNLNINNRATNPDSIDSALTKLLHSDIKIYKIEVNSDFSSFFFSYTDSNSTMQLTRLGIAYLVEVKISNKDNYIDSVLDGNNIRFNYTTYSKYLENPKNLKISSNEIEILKRIHAPHEFDDSCKLSRLKKYKSVMNQWLYKACIRKSIF